MSLKSVIHIQYDGYLKFLELKYIPLHLDFHLMKDNLAVTINEYHMIIHI